MTTFAVRSPLDRRQGLRLPQLQGRIKEGEASTRGGRASPPQSSTRPISGHYFSPIVAEVRLVVFLLEACHRAHQVKNENKAPKRWDAACVHFTRLISNV